MARAKAEDRYRKRAPAGRIVLISGDNTRTMTVSPVVAGTLATVGAALSIAFLGATGYLVFRDDLLNAALSRNANLQQAYEDRIASLRAEIDKIASRQILDQVAFDQKVERLLSAQRNIDDRQKVVSGLIEKARKSGLLGEDTAAAPAAGDRADAGSALGYSEPAPVEAANAAFDALTTGSIGDRSPAADMAALDRAPVGPDGKIDVRAVGDQLAAIDAAQTAAVRAIAAAAKARAGEVAQIVARLGVKISLPETASADPAPTAGDGSGMGGPYIPLDGAEALASALTDATNAFETLGQVKVAVGRLPLQVPIAGASRTSNFGSRTDPFLGSVAFHAGIDFRSPSGTNVTATAAGRVINADYTGGYGNMVEIDHGRGLTTRYAHLSRIDVKVGQTVAKGEVVGEVGSTGRSTGPHLHYETRVNGAAINPETYLSAGDRIARLLR